MNAQFRHDEVVGNQSR